MMSKTANSKYFSLINKEQVRNNISHRRTNGQKVLRGATGVLLAHYLGVAGCSLNIVFFSKILIYIPDFGLSRLLLGVYTGLHAAELAELRKMTTF